MDRKEEFALKVEWIRSYLSGKDLSGVMLSRSDNFAWAGCGANNVVHSASETGVGTLDVSRDSVILIANNIEAERLLTEELNGLDIENVRTFPWHQPQKKQEIMAQLSSSGSFAADDGCAGLPVLAGDFVRLRYELTKAEIERYRELGWDSSMAMESAARRIQKGMTEAEVAALTASQYRQRGISPVVLLVAADERIRHWRHPVPKSTPARQYVMLVTCGRRAGLVTAMTRFVHFGEIPEDLRRRHQAVCEVDAAFILNTSAGKTAAEVLAAGQETYRNVGRADEWELHHQGGAIGYQPREYIATPHCREIIRDRQAFAWNPSIRGTKSEDTILLSAEGIELLTAPSERWPTITVEIDGRTIKRADMLVK